MQWCTDNSRTTHLWIYDISYYKLQCNEFSNRLHSLLYCRLRCNYVNTYLIPHYSSTCPFAHKLVHSLHYPFLQVLLSTILTLLSSRLSFSLIKSIRLSLLINKGLSRPSSTPSNSGVIASTPQPLCLPFLYFKFVPYVV